RRHTRWPRDWSSDVCSSDLVRWLGFDWDDRMYYASDYFGKLYEYAVQLIKDGNAYVDSLNADEIREYRGTLTEPGKNSPYRNRRSEERRVGKESRSRW